MSSHTRGREAEMVVPSYSKKYSAIAAMVTVTMIPSGKITRRAFFCIRCSSLFLSSQTRRTTAIGTAKNRLS